MPTGMVSWPSRKSDAVGANAGISFAEVEAAGPAARPLEFPSPTVHRGHRITVNACDHNTGEIHRIKNVLVREKDFSDGIPHVPSRGYCIKRKLCDSAYGSVRLCVVMKRRHVFYSEGPRKESSGAGSLESICEERDWVCESLDRLTVEDNVIWESTDEYAVVKVMSWAKIRHYRGRHLEDPVKEVAAMQLLGNYNPYVMGSLEVIQDDDYLYSVTPYCEGGDLYSWTMNEIQSKESGRLEESQARQWFRQIILGLNHLQNKGVCHRDLSLENILVHENRCIIIDMGMCLRVPYSDPCNDNLAIDASAGTVRRLIQAQGQGGRWTYMAPEVVAREDKFDGFAIDLWAAGVILYIMLVGRAPFKWAHESDVHFQMFAGGQLKETLRHWEIPISNDACDLLQGMFWREPHRRLTLAQVMNHPWVANGGDQIQKGPEKEVHVERCTKIGSRPSEAKAETPECSKHSKKWLLGKLKDVGELRR